jgi:hypothetical protein
MLMKLTPGVNFNNILHKNFFVQKCFAQLLSSYTFVIVIFCFKNICARFAPKMLKLISDEGMPPCKPMERHKFLKAFHTAETNTFVMGGMARFHLLIHKARAFNY